MKTLAFASPETGRRNCALPHTLARLPSRIGVGIPASKKKIFDLSGHVENPRTHMHKVKSGTEVNSLRCFLVTEQYRQYR
jgi:hypothetical protein